MHLKLIIECMSLPALAFGPDAGFEKCYSPILQHQRDFLRVAAVTGKDRGLSNADAKATQPYLAFRLPLNLRHGTGAAERPLLASLEGGIARQLGKAVEADDESAGGLPRLAIRVGRLVQALDDALKDPPAVSSYLARPLILRLRTSAAESSPAAAKLLASLILRFGHPTAADGKLHSFGIRQTPNA